MEIFTNGGWHARLARTITLVFLWQAPQLAVAQTPAATWQWATRATSTTAVDDFSRGRFIKVDGAGNTFSAGDFHGTLTLGGNTLASPGNYDGFVAKYTPTGSVAWVRHLDGSSAETIVYALTVDNNGNSYVSGYYYAGSMVIGTTTLTGGGGFLVKYDPQGTVLWVRAAGEVINALATTATGEVVAMGSFNGTQVFGSTTLTSASSGSGFLVKYDAQGTAQWARQWEGTSDDEGFVGLDAAGNAYIAADFDGPATFGTIGLPGSADGDDVFVAKYSASGTPQWAVRQPVASGPGREHAWGLATDAAGNTYVTGSSELAAATGEQWFVTQYTPQGTVGWNHLSTAVPARSSGLQGIATDAAGNVCVAGVVSGSFSIGGLTLASSGSSDADMALLSFTPQGFARWGLSAGTATAIEAALGVALDATNNLYITGLVQGNTTLGALTLPQNSASEEQFTAKVSISTLTATVNARAAEPLQVYPNPASGGVVKVRWSALMDTPGQLLVHDALGRLVHTNSLPAGRTEAMLPSHDLARGVYTLHLKTATATAIGRLVIE